MLFTCAVFYLLVPSRHWNPPVTWLSQTHVQHAGHTIPCISLLRDGIVSWKDRGSDNVVLRHFKMDIVAFCLLISILQISLIFALILSVFVGCSHTKFIGLLGKNNLLCRGCLFHCSAVDLTFRVVF